METKDRILERAGELFPALGIKNVMMDFIAADLGISKRTIYEIFENKDELVFQVIENEIIKNNLQLLEIIDQTENAIEALFVITENEHQRMSTYNPLFLGDIKKLLPKMYESFYKGKQKIREFSVSFAILEKGRKEQIFRPELDIDVVDSFMNELVIFLHGSQRFRLMNLSKGDVLKNIMLPYFRGICTSKGQELMDKYFKSITT